MMELFEDNNNWDLDLDYTTIIEDSVPDAFYWNNQSACMDIDVELSEPAIIHAKVSKRKRELSVGNCSRAGAKASREKVRREKMNDRFSDLSSILEPGKAPMSDKSAIISDAIRAVNQLRSEAQELREINDKLRDDIKNLKAEKHQLRGEKNMLKVEKEKIEQQVKSRAAVHTAFMPATTAYPVGTKKMMGFPATPYGGFPMWQWISPTVMDTTQDHVLRPPVA
ncbi:unnamed protein product [Rhodiola kirilowii]